MTSRCVSKERLHKENFESLCHPRVMPKNDGSWRMHLDRHAINKIILKYMFSIHRHDDLLDTMAGSSILLKFDLHSGNH